MVSVVLDEAGVEAIEADVQTDVIQIVRELFSNIARHASATRGSSNLRFRRCWSCHAHRR